VKLLPFSFFFLPLFALLVTAQTSHSDQASGIAAIVQKAMKTEHLRAAIANSSDTLFRSIGLYLAPNDPPPAVPTKG
jgi:hypothetical protein